MVFDRRNLIPIALLALVPFTLSLSNAALAQSAMEQCIQNGFKPGSSGFYRCLQSASSGDSADDSDKKGDAGSGTGGAAQDAAPDFSGSSMDGATAPDPNVLKNFNPGGGANR